MSVQPLPALTVTYVETLYSAWRQSSYMPPWIYTVLGRRWFRINERNGGSEKAAASRMGVSKGLLYDGFFSFAVVWQLI